MVTDGAARCRQCGTDDPLADKLGWLELRYEYGPGVHARFCGGTCAAQWLGAAQGRLLGAVLGEGRWMTDDAVDLGTIRARRLALTPDMLEAQGQAVIAADIRALVAAYDAQAARLAAARNALVVLYELNEAGNVGGAVYEEAMDLAMDVLRDTETATGAVGAGEGHDGD